jgi:hypothetical protein
MKICLIENRAPGELPAAAAGYVAELGPALTDEHRVSILTVDPGIAHWLATNLRTRRCLKQDASEIVHVNNLTGAALGAVIDALGAVPQTFKPQLVIGLHDERLLSRQQGMNRWLTRSAGLVVSSSSRLLDEHLARGFFGSAITDVIPYGMPYHAVRVAQAYRRLIISRRGRLGDRAA